MSQTRRQRRQAMLGLRKIQRDFVRMGERQEEHWNETLNTMPRWRRVLLGVRVILGILPVLKELKGNGLKDSNHAPAD